MTPTVESYAGSKPTSVKRVTKDPEHDAAMKKEPTVRPGVRLYEAEHAGRRAEGFLPAAGPRVTFALLSDMIGWDQAFSRLCEHSRQERGS